MLEVEVAALVERAGGALGVRRRLWELRLLRKDGASWPEEERE